LPGGICFANSLVRRTARALILARRVHLKTDVIHRLECSEYELSVRELYAIARALSATLSDMMH
jgi:hypothetical protein